MTSNIRFDEIAQLKRENVNPKNFPDEKYIGLEHISQGGLTLLGHGYGRDVDSQKQRFYKGDVLFGKLRPYFRKVIRAPFDGICSTDIWVVKAKDETDANFIKYWMASKEFISASTHAAEGSRMPRAQWDWVSDFESPIEDSLARKAIGGLLEDLDVSISINAEFAKTLEGVAHTIFKSWFIDFDPVHAKARGEQPEGMDAETAALFPDSFEDSELGPIPAGWHISPLSEAIQLISGGTPKTNNEDYWGGDIPWYSVGDVPTSGAYFTTTAKYVTQLGLQNSAVNLVDTHTTIISARGTVGKVCMAGVRTTFNQSCYGVSGGVSPFFTYLLVSENVPRLLNIAHGGAFDTITRDSFSAINISRAPSELQKKFHEFVEPLFGQSLNLAIQNQTLEELRDSLLPRLISGELEIPEELLGE